MKPEYPPGLEWLPDWKDPSQYPPVKGTTGTQWAWEFLRRNPEYRQAYSKLWEQHPTDPRPAPSPDLLPNVLWPLQTEEEIEMCRFIVQRFHLTEGLFPPDPRTRHIGEGCFNANWFRYYRLDKDQSIRKNGFWDTRILMEFDLSLPVEPQLKDARRILGREGKGKARNKGKNLTEYLRILDARSEISPLTWPHLAKVIFRELAAEEKNITKDHPLVSRAKESHRAACKLRDTVHWKLVPLA